jgi:hypothetical protein
LEALVPEVEPPVLAVTQIAPARGIATPAVPLTVARLVPETHAPPSQRWSWSRPLAA